MHDVAPTASGGTRTAGEPPRSGSAARRLRRRPRAPPAPRPVRLLGRLGKLVEAGVDPAGALPLQTRKPTWLRANAHMGQEFNSLRKTVRGLGLVTVCEEAGCPNIFECWADGTATFMINGDRCTRACGFCQVNTSKPLPLDPDEPEKVAEAVARLRLAHAVVTCVARDDLEDGGASGFAETIDAIRRRCPGTAVEVLISDCKGDPASLDRIFERRPDVLNHNVETVPRLATGGPALCFVRQEPGRAGPGQGSRPHHQVRSDARPGRDRGGSRRAAGRPASDRRIHSDDRAVPAAQRQPPARGPLVVSGGLREDRRSRPVAGPAAGRLFAAHPL